MVSISQIAKRAMLCEYVLRKVIENFSATLELHLKNATASVLGVVVEIDKMTFFVNLALS